MNPNPLRSVLFMPGANQRAMDKARQLAADAIVFDLEDAVAPQAKDSARQAVLAQLAAGGYGQRQLAVRCNAPGTPWGADDIRALARSGIQTLCLPKVETPDQLQEVRDLLSTCGRPDMQLWAMIETPSGVDNVRQLAAFESVQALLLGTTDLCAALRVPQRPDRLGLQYALSRCVLAARQYGVAALDGVHLDLADRDGFVALCEQGRALGFDGKTLIHPRQIEPANRVFGPSAQAIEHARRLLVAWREAQAADRGVAVLDGALVEVMHVDQARRTLDLAAQIASLEADASRGA
ncbi:MAG: CoA ester lyase [Halioglobus sp.]|nr:CoA ester lyase [Halioglobus sp.]